jgi:hypothetical protein
MHYQFCFSNQRLNQSQTRTSTLPISHVLSNSPGERSKPLCIQHSNKLLSSQNQIDSVVANPSRHTVTRKLMFLYRIIIQERLQIKKTNDAHSCENNSRRNNRGIEKQERLSLATLTSYIQKLSSTMSSQSKHMRTKVSFKISSWQRQDHEDGVPFRRLRLNSHGTLKKNDRELPSLFRVELRLNPSKPPLTSENRHKRDCYFELEKDGPKQN